MEEPHFEFVETPQDLATSVRHFMEEPKYWREAVNAYPKYFVHLYEGGKHLFGLSKFAAFKNVTLGDYVTRLRSHANGNWTQKRISSIVGRAWVPVGDVPAEVRDAFTKWFYDFYPSQHPRDDISILTLETQPGKGRKPKRPGSGSGARALSPQQLANKLQLQSKIGNVGEEIAMQHEIARLASLGVRDAERWVERVSTRNTAAGFDILSSPPGKEHRFIEVKSSKSASSDFYITRNELTTLNRHGDQAYLYLVHITDLSAHAGNVVREIQNPAQVLSENGVMEPVLFHVSGI